MEPSCSQPDRGPFRLGVVSFLNSKPLIEGLANDPRVVLRFDVPSALSELLRENEVDAALIPTIDLARSDGRWQRISDACIGSDGRTLTVRVFSKVPPERMDVLYADPDSHTSVALARMIWANVYHRPLRIEPLAATSQLRQCESVLLIGDKVVTTPMPWFDHHVDLGDAWKKWTGLPFVFAVWAINQPEAQARVLSEPEPQLPALSEPGAQATGLAQADLARILSEARDRGVTRAAEIAAQAGPAHGWPVDLAVEYMTHALTYKITPAAEAGMNRYFELLDQAYIAPQAGGLSA